MRGHREQREVDESIVTNREPCLGGDNYVAVQGEFHSRLPIQVFELPRCADVHFPECVGHFGGLQLMHALWQRGHSVLGATVD